MNIFPGWRKKLLEELIPSGFYLKQEGVCPCCEKKVVFRAENNWLRDHLVCSGCGSIPRERALTMVIEKYYPEWRNLNIHESSPIGRGASLKLMKSSPGYRGSHFYPGKELGTMVNHFRNEDLERQTFESESFDLVITQDVMEHLYHPEKAFSEIARTLKKGGAHIFTVPIINKHKPTTVWAKRGSDGNPVFLYEEEYHQNPVDPKGSAVTMHWGFDIVDFIRAESGLETTIEYIHDMDYGIWAEYVEVLVSVKR